jgi:transcription factor SFP1
MEKEKPYKCEQCGKRYKNLNGLKYVSTPLQSSLVTLLTPSQHKQHSPPCDPERKLNSHLQASGLGGVGLNIAGLPGLPEEML